MKFNLQHLVNLSSILLAILWFFVLIWRKPFSYITIGNLYIIDFIILLCIVISLSYFFAKNSFRLRLKQSFVWPSLFLSLFFLWSLIGVLGSESINLKAMIPIIYPLFLIPFYMIISNSSEKLKERILNFMILCYAILFILFYGIREYLLIGFTSSLPDVSDAGWTFASAISLAVCISLIRTNIITIILSAISLVGLILLFQRGAILCFLLALFFVILHVGFKNSFRLYSLKFFSLFCILILSMAFIETIAANILNLDISAFRYEISAEFLFNFVGSIFSSDVDLGGDAIGTRNHRLEMWYDIIQYNLSSWERFLFGNGFSGEVGDVLGISFRSPHNGFITIFYRMGILGVLLFILILVTIFKILTNKKINKKTLRYSLSEKASIFGLINLGAFLGDMLTGTIIDSPFTQFLFVFSITLCASLVLDKKNEYSTS